MEQVLAQKYLRAMLRPAGAGVHVVSTGTKSQAAFWADWYGTAENSAVRVLHETALESIGEAKVVVLGVPSDAGAGIRKGANQGPQSLRRHWQGSGRGSGLGQWGRTGVVDVGDIFTVPHFLHDDMLNEAQIRRSQAAMYGDLHADVAEALPVSPLSMAELVLETIYTLNPSVRVLLLGGDHSVALPLSKVLSARRDIGILQFDAHTDLLASRLGVEQCFATWSWHAKKMLRPGAPFVQVGIRASGKTKDYWEKETGVRQWWADEVRRDEAAALSGITEVLRTAKDGVYISNDIDGTTSDEAPATGTPEPNGLSSEFVIECIRRATKVQPILAADVVEVAPDLGDEAGRTRTLECAVKYIEVSLDAMSG